MLVSMPDDLPEILLHYTGIHALQGIWENGELWSTEAFYLNDTSELRLGLAAISTSVLRSQTAIYKKQTAAAKESLDRLRRGEVDVPEDQPHSDELDELKEAERLLTSATEFRAGYVVSLSEKPDQLSQWRAYAKAGYCLGFSTDALRSCLSGHKEMRRVSYMDSKNSTELAAGIVDLITQRRNALLNQELYADEEAVRDYIVKTSIVTEAAFMKDRSFHEEAEVRIVETNVLPDFHTPSKFGMVPRRRIKLPENALQCVIVGPGPHMEQRVESLRSYFRTAKFGGNDSPTSEAPVVLPSRIPYRDW